VKKSFFFLSSHIPQRRRCPPHRYESFFPVVGRRDFGSRSLPPEIWIFLPNPALMICLDPSPKGAANGSWLLITISDSHFACSDDFLSTNEPSYWSTSLPPDGIRCHQHLPLAPFTPRKLPWCLVNVFPSPSSFEIHRRMQKG